MLDRAAMQPFRPRAILFDLDGTLVDSHASIVSAIRATTAEHGLPTPTDAEFEAAVSLPLRSMLGMITKSEEPVALDAYAATYLRHYVVTMVELSDPFEGIGPMLDELAALSLPLAVLTNKTEVNAQRIVEARLGADRFAVFVGSVPGRPNKPDPTGARLAAERLGVAPSECWLIGDSRIDLDTARAAGMLAVGVRWGITATLAEKIADADRLVDRPEQLVRLVRSFLD